MLFQRKFASQLGQLTNTIVIQSTFQFECRKGSCNITSGIISNNRRNCIFNNCEDLSTEANSGHHGKHIFFLSINQKNQFYLAY